MRIVVGVTGSIAAYRSPDLVKELKSQGHDVRVILTHSAKELVSARVLATFSENPVQSDDIFSADHSETDHISTARWADLCVVYAASADFIARYAGGQAGDFLSLQLLAATCPVILAPAMNPSMWEHPANLAHIETLRSRGVQFAMPIHGKVACGETGVGHIASIQDIVSEIKKASGSGALYGKRVLISAGPMRTAMDSVRFVQNRSSGKMGLELARAARRQGARVSVLLGPVDPAMAAEYAEFHPSRYEGPAEYGRCLDTLFPECDVFFSAAAVLDFEIEARPGKIAREELARSPELNLSVREVPDFVARMASRAKQQTVIAFAAESGTDAQIQARALKKMNQKGVDFLIANPVRAGLGPEADQNELWVFRRGANDATTAIHLGPDLKENLAVPLLAELFGAESPRRR